MQKILITGFPGFICSELIRKLLPTRRDDFICLVQEKYFDHAEMRRKEICESLGVGVERIQLVLGDITEEGLGIRNFLHSQQIREVYHLAAVYDLSVPKDFAWKVNVLGTRHVVRFLKNCPNLERFHYISTCYVSGRFDGVFHEEDLVKGQVFNNYYEETKYHAEVIVQEEMRQGLVATIYRLGIVVGDSVSGFTQKYDGPYFLLQWLMRQPRYALLPSLGNEDKIHVNIVPCDFVVNAMAHLSGIPTSRNRVYHLSDPNPLTVQEFLDQTALILGKKIIKIPLSEQLAKFALRSLPGVYSLMKINPDTIDYFTHPTIYTSKNAQQDLAAAGLVCPSPRDYLENLISFMKTHKEVSSSAMA